MALGWKEIETLTNRKKCTIRKWIKRYNDFPLLRHPNGQLYMSLEMYENWLKKHRNPPEKPPKRVNKMHKK